MTTTSITKKLSKMNYLEIIILKNQKKSKLMKDYQTCKNIMKMKGKVKL